MLNNDFDEVQPHRRSITRKKHKKEQNKLKKFMRFFPMIFQYSKITIILVNNKNILNK